MLTTAYDLKEPLLYIEKNTSHIEYKSIAFNSSDWFIIKNLIKIFEIFVKPSVKLQGQVYITLSTALIYIFKIYRELFTLKELFERLATQNDQLVSKFLYFILLNIATNFNRGFTLIALLLLLIKE